MFSASTKIFILLIELQWTTLTTPIPADITGRSFVAVHKNHLYIASSSTSKGAFVIRVAGSSFDYAEKLNAPPQSEFCRGLVSHNNCLYYLARPTSTDDPDQHCVLFRLVEDSQDSGQGSQPSLQWERLPNGRCPVKQLVPAFLGKSESLLLAGGKDSDGDSFTLVTEYNLRSGDWCTPTAWPHLPAAAQQQHPVSLGDGTHLFGGIVFSGTKFIKSLSSVHSIKAERSGSPSGEWREGVLPSTPDAGSGACELFQTVLVAGGVKSGHQQQEVHILDPDTQEWLQLPSLCSAKSQAAMAFYQGCLFAIGGFSSIWLPTVERFPLSWTYRPIPRIETRRKELFVTQSRLLLCFLRLQIPATPNAFPELQSKQTDLNAFETLAHDCLPAFMTFTPTWSSPTNILLLTFPHSYHFANIITGWDEHLPLLDSFSKSSRDKKYLELCRFFLQNLTEEIITSFDTTVTFSISQTWPILENNAYDSRATCPQNSTHREWVLKTEYKCMHCVNSLGSKAHAKLRRGWGTRDDSC